MPDFELQFATGSPAPFSPEQVQAICQRAFGPSARLRRARELGGGLVNRVLRLEVEGQPPAVLRLAPPPEAPTTWDTAALETSRLTCHLECHHVPPARA